MFKNNNGTENYSVRRMLQANVRKQNKMGCNSIVRLGTGTFNKIQAKGGSGLSAWDGHKYVCEDDFIEGKECLVYSFGVSADASFEEAMAAIGIKLLIK